MQKIGKILLSYRKHVNMVITDRVKEFLFARFGENNIITNFEFPTSEGVEAFLEKKFGEVAVMVAIIGDGWDLIDDFNSNDLMATKMATSLSKRTSVILVLLDEMKFPPRESLPISLQTLDEELSVSINTESWEKDIRKLEVIIVKELVLSLCQADTGLSCEVEMRPPPRSLSLSIDDRYNKRELGLVGANITETRRAIEYYLGDLQFAEKINDMQGQALALSNLGLAYAKMNETRRSIEYFKRRLILIREIGTFEELAETLASLGDAHVIIGQLESAKKYFYEQLALSKEVNNLQMESSALNGLGHIYIKVGKIEKGIECYKDCLKGLIQRRDLNKQGELLVAIGLNYVKLRRYKEAIIVQERAVEIYKELGNSHEEGLGLLDMADSNAYIKNFGVAISLGRQAIKLLKENSLEEVRRVQKLIAAWEKNFFKG